MHNVCRVNAVHNDDPKEDDWLEYSRDLTLVGKDVDRGWVDLLFINLCLLLITAGGSHNILP